MTMFLSLVMLAADSAADPLAPASAGKVQCYHPDAEHRRCRSMARYRVTDDSRYANEAVVLLQANPPVVMTTITPVNVESGAICGAIRPEDVATAAFAVNGAAFAGDQLSAARARIGAAMTPLFSHRICTRYIGGGPDLTARASVDGVEQPTMTDTVRWVDEAEGWTVGP